MMRSKATAIALFISIGVNVFLLGVFAAHFLAHPHAPHQDKRSPEEHPALRPPPLHGSPTQGPQGHSPPGPRLAKSAGKSGGEEADGGPRDLKMLRQMIQIMGGRKDERVRKFWDATHEEGKDARKSLREARMQVQEALLASPFVKADLEQALAKLAEQTSATQSHAQNALVTLASQLTDDERAKLRETPSPERRGERK